MFSTLASSSLLNGIFGGLKKHAAAALAFEIESVNGNVTGNCRDAAAAAVGLLILRGARGGKKSCDACVKS